MANVEKEYKFTLSLQECWHLFLMLNKNPDQMKQYDLQDLYEKISIALDRNG
jgi:hypothetical protein